MAYRHGVYISEVPTRIISPVNCESAMPVYVVTAPLHLSETGLEDLDKKVNHPILTYTYEEGVKKLGFIRDSKRWKDYTSCECLYSQFALYGIAPAVFINVLDPRIHKKSVDGKAYDVVKRQALLGEDVILDSVVVKADESGVELVPGTDFSLAWDKNGNAVLNTLVGGAIADATSVWAEFDVVDPTQVTALDIIGGYNNVTKRYEGLELVNSIFPKYRLVPCQIVVPKWGGDSAVAAVMYAKADSINGVFRAMAMPFIPANPTTGVIDYTEAPEWKNRNNFVYDKQIVDWPKIKLGGDIFHLGVQLSGLMGKVDSRNNGVPVEAFSNVNLQMDALCLDDGTEIDLDLHTQANYLNGEGITTAVNWIGGWRAWGVQTACYPANTDPKDCQIPIRRMFNWIGNTIVLTYFQKVDRPLVKRNIETVIDSVNLWLNGLAAREYLIGHPYVTFVEEENPLTDLIAGIVRFHVRTTPPPAMKELEFIMEFDVSAFATLFA